MSKTIYEILEETNPSHKDTYYSPCFNYCKVKLIKNEKKIYIYSKDNENKGLYLDEEGKLSKKGDCLIFPSKDNRDWEIELEKSKQFLPVNTPIMMSDSGESWSLGYYQNNKWCKPFKNSERSSHWKYIVPVANFNFEDPESNIKRSIKITEK